MVDSQHSPISRSLYLYPLPDLVVIADKFEPFTAEHLECKVINPGKELVFNNFIGVRYFPKGIFPRATS